MTIAISNKNKTPVAKFLLRMIGMIMSVAPLQFWLGVLVAILHSLSIVAITVSNMELFDRATGLTQGLVPIRVVFQGVVFLGMANISNLFFNGLHGYMYSVRSTKLIGIFKDILHKKASKLAPIKFEDAKFLDSLEKAKKGIELGLFATDLVVTILTCYLPYFLFMAIFLGSLSPLLIFTLVLIFIPIVVGQVMRMKRFSSLEDQLAPLRRQIQYHEKSICDRQFFKETRILGSYSFLKQFYKESIFLFNKQSWAAEKKSMLQMLCMKGLTVLGYVGILIILINLLLKGQISPGSFAAVFTSLTTMFSIAEEIVNTHIGSVAKDAASIRNLIDFLDMDENVGHAGKLKPEDGLILTNVCFRYPNSDLDVIKDVSLHISCGEIVAIVGENGAGKSTLIKILSGIYKPTNGVAILGGLDTTQTDPIDLYQYNSAVFQNYQRYKMTLQGNIAISKAEGETDISKILDVMKQAEVQYTSDHFPDGLDTMLSREFDGVDLSGGQWQRIAIARGVYRDNAIMFLDEPTAAIDPLEESELYRHFSRISKGKTTVIVTHRLGSARIADRIIVIKEGEIDDIGTHEQLMERDGYYAHMYHSQARWYVH